MGIIDYMSKNPVAFVIPPSKYDKELTSAFINNLELIDNVILNNLTNQNKAPYEMIEKRVKNKGMLDASLNIQLTTQHSKHSASGQLQTHNQIQFHSKSAHKRSILSPQYQPSCKKLSLNSTVNLIRPTTMSCKSETKGLKGGFIPTELN